MPLFSRHKTDETAEDRDSDGREVTGGRRHTGTRDDRLAPDDPRKPASPTDLGGRSWLGVAKRAFAESKDDNGDVNWRPASRRRRRSNCRTAGRRRTDTEGGTPAVPDQLIWAAHPFGR